MATVVEMEALAAAYKEAVEARQGLLEQIRLLKAQKVALIAAIGEIDEQIAALRTEAAATKTAARAAIVAQHQAILAALQTAEDAANP